MLPTTGRALRSKLHDAQLQQDIGVGRLQFHQATNDASGAGFAQRARGCANPLWRHLQESARRHRFHVTAHRFLGQSSQPGDRAPGDRHDQFGRQCCRISQHCGKRCWSRYPLCISHGSGQVDQQFDRRKPQLLRQHPVHFEVLVHGGERTEPQFALCRVLHDSESRLCRSFGVLRRNGLSPNRWFSTDCRAARTFRGDGLP